MSNNKNNDYLLDKAVNSDDKTTKEKAYCRYIKNVTPTKNLLTNMFKAFIVGGLICTFGQLITNILKEYNLSKDDVAALFLFIILSSILLKGNK